MQRIERAASTGRYEAGQEGTKKRQTLSAGTIRGSSNAGTKRIFDTKEGGRARLTLVSLLISCTRILGFERKKDQDGFLQRESRRFEEEVHSTRGDMRLSTPAKVTAGGEGPGEPS